MDEETAKAGLFAGNGNELAALHANDWAASLLGPVAAWRPALEGAARICLPSKFQMAALWGEQFVYLYNDAASTLFGDKHPWALGQPVSVVWPEAWPIVGPMLDSVRASGRATRSDDLLLVLERNGGTEECYLTFSYSPVFVADGSVGGLFVAFMETTGRVQAERRQRAAADIAAQVALRRSGDDSLALARHPHDLPLVALVLSAPGQPPSLGFVEGPAAPLPPATVALLLRCAVRCLSCERTEVFDAATPLAGAGPCGPWPVAPRQPLGVPFRRGGDGKPRIRRLAPQGTLVSAWGPLQHRGGQP